MDGGGCRLACDLVVGRIRANFDVLGPRDLPELPEVNRPKKRFIRERREDPAANVASKINHAVRAVGVHDSNPKICQRFDMSGTDHGKNVYRVSLDIRERF